MQLGRVIGHATSTIKHRSLNGWRLVVVQPVNVKREAEADPVIAVRCVLAAASWSGMVSHPGISKSAA